MEWIQKLFVMSNSSGKNFTSVLKIICGVKNGTTCMCVNEQEQSWQRNMLAMGWQLVLKSRQHDF